MFDRVLLLLPAGLSACCCTPQPSPLPVVVQMRELAVPAARVPTRAVEIVLRNPARDPVTIRAMRVTISTVLEIKPEHRLPVVLQGGEDLVLWLTARSDQGGERLARAFLETSAGEVTLELLVGARD